MKFRVEREALADAVAWTAKSLPARPPVPVLAGVLLTADADRLMVSGFDYEVSTQVGIDVSSDEAGKVLVSGRLLAEITRALPAHPVQVVVEGAKAEITCGSARFTLPTMPVEDYPTLPSMPTVAGTLNGATFANAVHQVAIAAGRDDTLPMLTGVRLELESDRVTLAATDRYRLAVRELTWHPGSSDVSTTALVPARTLSDTAKALASADEVQLALSQPETGEGIIGFAGADRRSTTRLLDAEFVKYRSLLPDSFAARATVPTATLTEVIKRVALVAERNTPIRLSFTKDELTAEAGGSDDARASETTEATYDGDEMTVAFNPAYLLDGLNAIESDTAVLSFTAPQKPAVITGADENGSDKVDYRYVLMPVRLTG
ncbi:DNA polymerase III subunit beta [Fodinicola acaciae]|uniref:DNA polymerase III subunit beta n=1 Tax=Fodinicola acaciae TaxID=2681555 RepID=UPI0013D55EEB|nr:DNA polymerase III subunit beta [Fodinicola acaciae]